MRVQVWNGDKSKYLGEGEYSEDVTVYVFMEGGGIRSMIEAEEMPPPELVPAGSEVVALPDNPKIVLDDGTVVYGCQVWWQPAVDLTPSVN